MAFNFDVQHIIDGQGISIAITGMVIVFFALSFISLFIAALPSILDRVALIWPEPEGDNGTGSASSKASDAVSEEIVAAIAVTLHRRRTQG